MIVLTAVAGRRGAVETRHFQSSVLDFRDRELFSCGIFTREFVFGKGLNGVSCRGGHWGELVCGVILQGVLVNWRGLVLAGLGFQEIYLLACQRRHCRGVLFVRHCEEGSFVRSALCLGVVKGLTMDLWGSDQRKNKGGLSRRVRDRLHPSRVMQERYP